MVFPICCKRAFVLLKCLLPNQYPRLALKGEGCPEVRIWCLSVSIKAAFFFANPPHSKKITPLRSFEIVLITLSVKVSQPFLWWLPASCALTVKVAFKSNTPWFAHRSKFPLLGYGIPKSFSISLKILINDGGCGMSSVTEKQSPFACFGPW